MPAEVSVQCTLGQPGAGKTFARCAVYLTTDFLPFQTGRIWTNFPINPDAMAEEAAKVPGCTQTKEEIQERIKIIPREVLDEWRAKDNPDNLGFWQWFEGVDLRGDHIALDEAQYFVGYDLDDEMRRHVKEWLSMIRHRQCRIEFLSQDDALFCKEVQVIAGTRYRIQPDDERHDAIFKIRYGDWWELKALFLGAYIGRSWQIQEIRMGRRWQRNGEPLCFWRHPKYFKLYNSYNKPHEVEERQWDAREHGVPTERGYELQDGDDEQEAPLYEFQKRSVVGLLWWFFYRNSYQVCTRGALLAFIFYFTFGGGWALIPWFIRSTMEKATQIAIERDQEERRNKAAGSKPKVTPTSGRPKFGDPLPAADESAVLQAVKGSPGRPPPVDTETGVRLSEQEAAELQQLAEDFDKLTHTVAASFEVTGLQPGAVTFANGMTYRLMDRIDFGPFKGKRVVRIDYHRRMVTIEGEQHPLRLGRHLVQLQGDGPAESYLARVRELVSRNRGDDLAANDTAEPARRGSDADGPRYEAGGLHDVGRYPSADQRSHRARVRR